MSSDKDFALRQAQIANFVSIEHDVPLAVARAFLHGVSMMILLSELPKGRDRESYERGLCAVVESFVQALGIDEAKAGRITDETLIMYGKAYADNVKQRV